MSAASVSCLVCADDKQPSDILSIGCAHTMCRTCWQTVLKTSIEKKYPLFDAGKLPCPSRPQDCKTTVPTAFVMQNASAETLTHIKMAESTKPDPSKSIESLTLDDFNYVYDDKGMLKHKITNGKFIFVNQTHYELLGDFVTIHIQRLLRDKYGLTELFLPFPKDVNATQFLSTDAKASGSGGGAAAATAAASDSKSGSGGSGGGSGSGASGSGGASGGAGMQKPPADGLYNNIFASKDALSAETLLILIQGSGAVRAGMWARALCINDSLTLGTIFPYLEKAKELGWGVVVLNPNLTRVKKTAAQQAEWKVARLAERAAYAKKTGREMPPDDEKSWNYQLASQWNPIPEQDTPRAHTLYCWDRVIAPAKAKQMVAVAHSAGGACTLSLLQLRTKDVLTRLRAVAFTDSVHSVPDDATKPVRQFMINHCINYVTSDDPLDTPVDRDAMDAATDGCPCVSAGHPKHEYTSGTAFPSVFPFLQKHLSGGSNADAAPKKKAKK